MGKRVLVVDNGGVPRYIAPGDGILNSMKDNALTTAGAGTILAALMASGLILRTGPGLAYADTLDTGANLDAAFPNMQVGDSIDFYHSNNVGVACTITASAGCVLNTAAANNVIAANSSKLIHIKKLGVASWEASVI